MDEFFELFQPGYKHLREERDRKRLEAQIPATAGPPFGVDLDAGVARIVVPPRETAPGHEGASEGATSKGDVHTDGARPDGSAP